MAKRYSPAEKVAIVLEVIRGESTLAEVCRRYGISQTIFYRWKEKFLQGAEEALSGPERNEVKRLKAKIRSLERLAGKQALIIEILKKRKRCRGKSYYGNAASKRRLQTLPYK